ncbi:hypothetical protein PPSIR1_33394 [Plesiocystis pacifica SIR-1]|uniref:Uncharacterized protein n=1 Tax=Plesiocystis pacifica SIR-1 TaxID=391625 RepID=A6G6N5_9BACT|nr:hypothetical protein [Plesiocystis pacifica]EDM78512.1 hypothetical protein PPSIR1_33394 [Plesiocystis pacifica SIR-1]
MSDPNPNFPNDLDPTWGGCKVKIKDSTHGERFLTQAGNALGVDLHSSSTFHYLRVDGEVWIVRADSDDARYVGVTGGGEIAPVEDPYAWAPDGLKLRNATKYLRMKPERGVMLLGLGDSEEAADIEACSA